MNVRELLKQGIEKRVEADARREASLPPTMRFGNSGAIIDGKMYGNCARLAHLRLLGFQMASDESTQILFSAGRAMEHVVYDFYSAVLPKERILSVHQNNEAVTQYQHPSGLPVVGHADFILLNEDMKEEVGLECKGKLSYWGVKGLIVDGKGYAAHIIQSAHYMWKHGLKQYAILNVTPSKYLTDAPEGWPQGSLSRSGKGWAVNPRIDIIDLWTAEDGTLRVRMPDLTEHKTKLKYEHIEKFYGEVAKMGPGAPLPVAPTNAGLFGKPSWKACDYCALRDICDSETSYEAWLDKSVDKITESWQENWPNLLDSYLAGWRDEYMGGE